MDKKTALEILNKFKASLERTGIPVHQMILFGSYATGTFTDDSDIDVVVVSEAFRELNHWQRIEKMTDALYELFQPIEPRALTPEEWESGESMTAAYARTSTLIPV
ncbi:MAG: nucleotidyltransferase domain-containing protein [Chitinivibrionales bacterium]|nr:nucleotidyltransferase domain-containing protein [Chitinivibrionales bacterium]